jgi:YihY family inner membrane protein
MPFHELLSSEKLAEKWQTMRRAARLFHDIDGQQRAAAFAYYAIFSLLPLAVLLATLVTLVVDEQTAAREILGFLDQYLPVTDETKLIVFDAMNAVIRTRGRTGTAAFIVVAWSALLIFKALIRAANRAWNTKIHNWWRLPLKSLLILLAVLGVASLGSVSSLLARFTTEWLFPEHALSILLYITVTFLLATLVLFGCIIAFYKLAPRCPVRLGQVWQAALGATLALRMLEGLFLAYLHSFGRFNVVYGAFGGILALMMWIYLSGSIVIFGACFCAAQAGVTTISGGNSPVTDTPIPVKR